MAKLLLIGCGKMGGAMLEGWLARGMAPADIVVVEPSAASRPAVAGLTAVETAAEVPATLRPEIVVLAVKPQSMDEVLPGLRRFGADGAVFLSIAAGKTLRYFADRLGADARLVRAMPNTPAAVRRGITVAVPGSGVSDIAQRRCEELLGAVGDVVWVADEALMDPVTALSGSGPAYVFLLAEAMAAAGAKLGLAPEMAMRLARVTVAGSGELLHRSSDSAAQLRVNVTSPGGTTAAALGVLMADDGLQPVFDRALAAASRRSRELAG